jgi:hypothetical protein
VSKKNRPGRGATATPRQDDGTLYDRMMATMWDAIAAGDPLRAELEVASCMTLPRIGQLRPDQVEDFSARVLVNEAIDRWGPEGTALLRLLMSLGSPRVKRAAGAALAEITRVGEAEQTLVAQVDLTGDPVARVVALYPDPAKVMEIINREDDPRERAEPIGLADARRRLDGPLARCDSEPGEGLSVQTLTTLPIARARVRRLPADR